MTINKNHLTLRKSIKKRKPKFTMQDLHKRSELKDKWRKPKGLQSKMRLSKKGYSRIVSIGWGSPSTVKYMHASGKYVTSIQNKKDLLSINSETHVGEISSTVGLKNRLDLLSESIKKNIFIINYQKPAEYIEEIKKKREQEKQKKKKRLDAQKQKETKKKTTDKKKSTLAEKIQTEEEKKTVEKKEKDKTLIKKDSI